MKKIYFTSVCFLTTFISQAQIVTIPDTQFKNALLNYIPAIDTNADNEIQLSEAAAVTDLTFNIGNLNDITGIPSFVNLVNLKIGFGITGLTNVDISGMTQLEVFEFTPISYVTALNVSGLPNLQRLIFTENSISTIDLSASTQLNYIDLSRNNLLSLNLAGLNELEYLNVSMNRNLNVLDVSPCTNLKILKCFDDELQTLNISGLTQLEFLDCAINEISGTLDVSSNSNLSYLNCGGNQLTSVTITGLAPVLTYLNCAANQLTAINVTGFGQLVDLLCGYNNIPNTIDLTGLTSLENLNCSHNLLASLNINALTTLKTLYCQNNAFASLNIDQLVNLTKIDCSVNQLTALNVNTLVNLTELSCYANQIANLPVSNLTQLANFYCGSNQLTALNVINSTALVDFNCNNNLLTTIDISQAPNLKNFGCGQNQLTTLDFTNSTKLTNVSCAENLFVSLDFSPMTDLEIGENHRYYFNNNPLLTNVNIKNGRELINDARAVACPNLRFICVDDLNINNVTALLMMDNVQNVQVNSYCSFVPGGAYNTITGRINLDLDNNGCDPNDYRFPQIRVGINDGVNSGAAFTNGSGDYTFLTQAGSFAITPQLENSFFTVTPISATLNFNSVNSSTQTQNFCISPLGIHNDLEITLFCYDQAKPGFDARYVLTYKNKGNQILSGNVNLAFDDAVLDFVSANPNVTTQSNNNINWDYTNLIPFETRTIFFILNVNGPTETPPVNIDDILNFTASITPIAGDETPADNIFELHQTVTGSFDPNDKTCLEGNTITPEMVGDYLHYVIRFQNSGTAAAENIVVKDIIDTAKFDIASLQLINASHPQVTKITGNKVEFQFENINLPAEINDEPGSHGFVAFKIKTKANLVIGNSVANKADIYFDYNFPIETNTATSTVALLGTNTFKNASVTVAPNPTKNSVRILSKGNISSLQLSDLQGRVLETVMANDAEMHFDLSRKATGIYFLKITTEKGIKIEKIIKE